MSYAFSASTCLLGSLGPAVPPLIQSRARIISFRVTLVNFWTSLISYLNVFELVDVDIAGQRLLSCAPG
jgi:hypothetical protein